MTDQTYLILGGAGLVGLQVARRIAHDLKPKKVVIVPGRLVNIVV